MTPPQLVIRGPLIHEERLPLAHNPEVTGDVPAIAPADEPRGIDVIADTLGLPIRNVYKWEVLELT